MSRIIWSPQALEDLDAIHDFIAVDAPRTARNFIQQIFNRVEQLERFPLSGTMIPELRLGAFRELRLRRYRIIYRLLQKDVVEIVTVYHGSRLLDPDLLLKD